MFWTSRKQWLDIQKLVQRPSPLLGTVPNVMPDSRLAENVMNCMKWLFLGLRVRFCKCRKSPRRRQQTACHDSVLETKMHLTFGNCCVGCHQGEMCAWCLFPLPSPPLASLSLFSVLAVGWVPFKQKGVDYVGWHFFFHCSASHAKMAHYFQESGNSFHMIMLSNYDWEGKSFGVR